MNDFSHICPNCCRESEDGGGYCPVCGTDAADIKNEEFCIPSGSVLLDRYFVGKVIGQGGFGITYLGYDAKFKTKIALKEYFPHGYAFRELHKEKHTVYSLSGEKTEFFNRGIDKFTAEARRLAQFSGAPGIVNVRDFFNENNTAYIVMEFVEGEPLGDILEKRGRLSETEVTAIFLPIIKTLQKVHATGILHRDIAPDNIMVEPDGTARLIDFGASAEVDEKAKTSAAVIKHFYVPEEQYDSNRRRQGAWTDVYALSATIFRALEGDNLPDALERLRGMPFDGFTVPVSAPVKDAVIHGLALFQKDRAQNVEELLAAFSGVSTGTSVYRKPKKDKTPKTAVHTPDEKKKPTKMLAGVFAGIAAIAAAVCLVIFLPRTSVPVGGELPPAETNAETTAETNAETEKYTFPAVQAVKFGTGWYRLENYTVEGLGKGEYNGSTVDYLPEGYGSLIFDNGDSFNCEWTKGVPNGFGTITSRTGETIKETRNRGITIKEGFWVNGVYQGKEDPGQGENPQTESPSGGTAATDTYVENRDYSLAGIGSGKYTGGMKDGKPEGKGVLTMSGGGYYDGDWVGGRPEGQGKMVFVDVATYTGGWKAGQYDGQGTLELSDGSKYVGGWKNGQKNGKGIEYNTSTEDIKPGTFDVVEGNFVNGNVQGDYTRTKEYSWGTRIEYNNTDDEQTGTYTRHVINKNNDGSVDEFDDVYVNANYQGNINSKHTSAEGDVQNYDVDIQDQGPGKYTGHLSDGKPDGQGTIIYNSGDKYVGGWKNGQYSGKGTYYILNNTKEHPEFKPNAFEERTGNWTDSHLVGEYTNKIIFTDNSYEIRYSKMADDGHMLGSQTEDGEVINHYEQYDASGRKTYECDEVRINNEVIERRNEKYY